MNEELIIFAEKLEEYNFILTKAEKKRIHFKSLCNFLFHFENLPNERLKVEVSRILLDYNNLLEIEGWLLEENQCRKIYYSHIAMLGLKYYYHLGFKVIMSVVTAFILGLLIDGLIMLLGFSKGYYYIPVATILSTSYNIILRWSKEKRKLLYGPHY